MRSVVAWWDLASSPQTTTTLRRALADDELRLWARVPGLVHKMWLADAGAQWWGAVMVWEDDAPREDLPANRATELIGYPPTLRIESEVVAAVERGAVSLPVPVR